MEQQTQLDKMPTHYQVIVGDITSGFRFFGPFDTEFEATEWAENYGASYGLSWTIQPLTPPFDI